MSAVFLHRLSHNSDHTARRYTKNEPYEQLVIIAFVFFTFGVTRGVGIAAWSNVGSAVIGIPVTHFVIIVFISAIARAVV